MLKVDNIIPLWRWYNLWVFVNFPKIYQFLYQFPQDLQIIPRDLPISPRFTNFPKIYKLLQIISPSFVVCLGNEFGIKT